MSASEVISFLLFFNLFSSYHFNPNDYERLQNGVDGLYKFHHTPMQWEQARMKCSQEAAQLAYPNNNSEAISMTSYIFERITDKTSGFWVGAHDKFSEGIYVNMEGVDLSMLYSNWSASTLDPNPYYDADCLIMDENRQLNEENCKTYFPFICKKKDSQFSKDCKTNILDYVPNEDLSRCYKVHTIPKNWWDAYATCHAEGSYLAIPNSYREVNFMLDLIKNIDENNIKVKYNKFVIALGFHDLFKEGEHETIYGKSLPEAGYNRWDIRQPDNWDNKENCGSMHRQGQLNDVDCNVIMLFICEKDLRPPQLAGHITPSNHFYTPTGTKNASLHPIRPVSITTAQIEEKNIKLLRVSL